MTSPYRPHPEPPERRSDWKEGDRVVVRFRPTTRSVLDCLEGEKGLVMEARDLDHADTRDQVVRVRFEPPVYDALAVGLRRFLDPVVVSGRLGGKFGDRLGDRFLVGADDWMFGGDLETL